MLEYRRNMLSLLIAATLPYANSVGDGSHLCGETVTSLIQVHGLSPLSLPTNSTHRSSCNDGEQRIVCFDVDSCAKMAPSKTEKFALVTSQVGQVGADSIPFLKSASAAAKLAKAELLLLLTQDDANFDPAMHSFFQQQGVRVETVPTLSRLGQAVAFGDCEANELVTLQLHLYALGLDRYDAIIFFDDNVEFQGGVTPLLHCAAAGNFLATNGKHGEVLHRGFLALKPHRVLFEEALEFAKEMNHFQPTLAQNGSQRSGQGENECRLDFLHRAFYKRSMMLNRRLLEAGQNHSSFQIIDQCVWNYQRSSTCGRDGREFKCSQIRAHREPLIFEPGQCLKRKYQNFKPSMSAVQGGQMRYVPKPLRPLGHAKLREEDERFPYKARFGFYFPVFNKLEGTVEVLRQLRRYYPEEPVYVMQDGGPYDFGPLCKKRFNCTFENLPGLYQSWNPHPFFARLLRAVEILQTKFVIYLEPDVKITRRHAVDPPLDAGGLYDKFNNPKGAVMQSYIERLAREREPCFVLRWTHYGLAGGSYFRSLAIRDALSPEKLSRIDWNWVLNRTGCMVACASDHALHLALSASAWSVYPWQEVAQGGRGCNYTGDSEEILERQERWPMCNPTAAFIHNHKEQYHANISDEDRSLVESFENYQVQHLCSGCVWYKDGSPESVMIPREPPKAKGNPRYDFQLIDPPPDCGAVAQEKWYYCAAEGEHCDCQNDIRWGNKDTWDLFPSENRQSEPFLCPDIPGADKHCECMGQGSRSKDNSFATTVVSSCQMFFEAQKKTDIDMAQWSAMKGLCSSGDPAAQSGPRQISLQDRTELFIADVIPEFKEVMERFTENGWFEEAYVSYVDGNADSPYVDMATEMIKSVHYFSTRPIVVFVFGEFIPKAWTPKRFPRLVVLHSKGLPQDPFIYRSFNFNKIRAVLLSKVKQGGVFLEADSWIAPGADTLFNSIQRHIEERRSPFPLLPMHFMNINSNSSGIGHSPWWSRYCPNLGKPCSRQTMKFGQSLPIWNHRSLEFFGRWLRRHLLDELLSNVTIEGSPVAGELRVGDVMEDEDLLNIGLWEDGATQQLCQFLQAPSALEPLLAWQHGDSCPECRDVEGDSRFYQDGSPNMFLIIHQAKNSTESAEYLERIRSKDLEGKWPPVIVYKTKFWKSASELHEAYPDIRCLT